MSLYGYTAQEVRDSRGLYVLVTFKRHLNLEPFEGRLYNIDPVTGTVILVNADSATALPLQTDIDMEGYLTEFKPTFRLFLGSSVDTVRIFEGQNAGIARKLIDHLDLSIVDAL